MTDPKLDKLCNNTIRFLALDHNLKMGDLANSIHVRPTYPWPACRQPPTSAWRSY